MAFKGWLTIVLIAGIAVLAVGVLRSLPGDNPAPIRDPDPNTAASPAEAISDLAQMAAQIGILSESQSEVTAEQRERLLREEQVKVAQQLCKVLPKSADAAFLLAMAYQEQGNSDAATVELRRALQWQPTHVDALEQLGVITHTVGEFEKSLQTMRRVLELDPQRLGIHLHIAEILAMQGQLDLAVEALQQELALNPHSGKAHRVLGRTYLQKQSYEEAKACLERAIAYEPQEPKAYYNLATVCARLKLTGPAREYRQRFKELEEMNQEAQRQVRMTLDPLHVVVASVAHTHTDAGRLYALAGQAGPTELLWKRAAQLDPNNLRCRLELAGLYQRAERPEQALEWCREVLVQDPNHGQVNYLIGTLQLASRRYDQAEAAFLKVIAVSPQRPEGYQALAGFFLVQKPDLPQAVSMAQQAVRLSSTAGNFALLAEAQWRSRNFAQAKAAAQQALNRAPLDPRIQALHQKTMGNP